jgi:hypothetical protein
VAGNVPEKIQNPRRFPGSFSIFPRLADSFPEFCKKGKNSLDSVMKNVPDAGFRREDAPRGAAGKKSHHSSFAGIRKIDRRGWRVFESSAHESPSFQRKRK